MRSRQLHLANPSVTPRSALCAMNALANCARTGAKRGVLPPLLSSAISLHGRQERGCTLADLPAVVCSFDGGVAEVEADVHA